MKPMKLRAWDRQRRAMFAVNGATFDAQYSSGFSKIAAYPYDEWNLSENNIPHDWVYLFDQIDRLVIMQFTGVYTYFGRKIYEGDIIEFQVRETGNIRYIGEVVFMEGSFMADMATPLSMAMFVKVIGNIHENSELLPNIDPMPPSPALPQG